MNIKILKTSEITDSLWKQVVVGYNEAFGLNETMDSLKDGFCISNRLGYSYHCFAYSDDKDLMGYTEFTPMDYENNLTIAVGGRTFIRKKYRDDFLLFAKIVNELKKRCAEDGVEVVTAVPNLNSRDYAIRINRFVYVADLDYYILPLKPSKFLHKPVLAPVDRLVSVIAKGWEAMNCLSTRIKNYKANIKDYRLITDEKFYENRFKRRCYVNYHEGKYRFTYRHYDDDGIDTIYVMDFREDGIRTSRALSKCLCYIMKYEKADAILFVGFMGMKQSALFKVPKRFIPKPLPFTFHVIDRKNTELIERMKTKDAWDYSLMNFDVR